jgi:hypothetical protein
VTFRQPTARDRALGGAGHRRSLIGWTEGRRPLLIHNVGIYSQAAYPTLENLRRTQGLCASPSRCLGPARAAEHDPLV